MWLSRNDYRGLYAAQLRRKMQEAGLSQSELARRTGLSVATISRYTTKDPDNSRIPSAYTDYILNTVIEEELARNRMITDDR